MAERFEQLEDKHIDFIQAQKMYFVGTAADDGYTNVSPKGMDSFRVLDNATVAWLNLTGSGNETAAHVLENGRMTVMFCSFDTQPLILRLYGQATVTHKGEAKWDTLSALFPRYTGARQIFSLALALVQTSCGFGVPFFEYQEGRDNMDKWINAIGEQGIPDYWEKKNQISLDGLPTHILQDEES